MRWIKKGLIFNPAGVVSWAAHSALTPTPLLLEDQKTIRIFAGFRDRDGVSRIGYVDLSADDPSRVLGFSRRPVLDVGRDGAFDDNGLILGDVLRHEGQVLMYYVGFQHVAKAKFLAFSGLATSKDEGRTFQRYSEVPILDRSTDSLYIRAIHSILFENGLFRVWYAVGNSWEWIGGKAFPCYHIWSMESKSPFNLNESGRLCVDVEGDEYRIGRPRVYRAEGVYHMFYTRGTKSGAYTAGYAESMDGWRWERKDAQLGLTPSATGWDSRHLCYPALLKVRDRVFAFYNGNDMGLEGFGYAELDHG